MGLEFASWKSGWIQGTIIDQPSCNTYLVKLVNIRVVKYHLDNVRADETPPSPHCVVSVKVPYDDHQEEEDEDVAIKPSMIKMMECYQWTHDHRTLAN